MTQVFIVVEADTNLSSDPNSLALTEPSAGAIALQKAILSPSSSQIESFGLPEVKVVTAQEIESVVQANSAPQRDMILCPLTLNLPDDLPFPGQSIYKTCRSIQALRRQVEQVLAYPTGDGQFWLPIVLTAKGPLYAEVIGRTSFFASDASKARVPGNATEYCQPIHLGDRWRQPLYQLGQRLLADLDAPPAVYLIQFSFQEKQVYFDRLLPFPALPAIASLGVQTPDLFTCHWRCLTAQPILDVAIAAQNSYWSYEPAVIS